MLPHGYLQAVALYLHQCGVEGNKRSSTCIVVNLLRTDTPSPNLLNRFNMNSLTDLQLKLM